MSVRWKSEEGSSATDSLSEDVTDVSSMEVGRRKKTFKNVKPGFGNLPGFSRFMPPKQVLFPSPD
ncbi:hypothetical protein QUA70_07130 [Microcoleus sp. LAD1_D5]|uniref:hypothetical protein n=1 Tax=unclassified Microcoleus TaxID=2642155 RepID=UPI002FD6C991